MVLRRRPVLSSVLCALLLGALVLAGAAPTALAEEADVVTYDDLTQMLDEGAPDPLTEPASPSTRVAPLALGGVIALDPGHGPHTNGSCDGAVGVDGLIEDDVNWKISLYTKERLEQLGVPVYLTRAENECPTLRERVERAAAHGAVAFICQHNNSYEDPAAHGFEIYVPNGGYDLSYRTHVEGRAFAERLAPKLEALGLYNRGIKEKLYPNSDYLDYYQVIRDARTHGIPGVIIEHAFVTNPVEADLLRDEGFLRELGYADAEAIYEQWGDQVGGGSSIVTPEPGETGFQGVPVAEPTYVEPSLEERFDVAPEGSIFRLVNPYTSEHLNTADRNEVEDNVADGWVYEGVKWVSPGEGAPVYRLYNPYSHEHFYTMDAHEYDVLGEIGWNQEGTAFRSASDADAIPVYRLFNPFASIGTHLYTTDPNEADTLVSEEGWLREGTLCQGIDPEAYEAPGGSTPIMGRSHATLSDLTYDFTYNLWKYGKAYPALYESKGAATPADFVRILWEEATAEGVRPDVLLGQVILETGWLQFGNDVSVTQCNFGGLGATGSGVRGNAFPDVRTGLRAQVQHLKAYASTASLENPCVDVRFGYVTRGSAPYLEDPDLWGTGSGYGSQVAKVMGDYFVHSY